jgi:hypothetical protein
MRRILAVLASVVILVAFLAWAAKPKYVTVEGEVMFNKLPMVGATVSLAGETAKVDKDGKFTVRILPGVYPVTVSCQGKSYRLNTDFESGVTFGLSSSPQPLFLWLTPEDEINRR